MSTEFLAAIQGTQGTQDLSGDRRPHLRPAGLGPRIRHHRFPHHARSQVALILRAQSLPCASSSMSLRMIRRAVALVFVLISSIIRFWLMPLRGPRTLERRARWVQKTCLGVLWSMEIRYRVDVQPPTSGLVVANHLSH